MNLQDSNHKRSTSRREFLQQSSGVLAGAALAGAINVRAYASEDNTIKVALVRCGGRGTGAAVTALSTQPPTKLVATAEIPTALGLQRPVAHTVELVQHDLPAAVVERDGTVETVGCRATVEGDSAGKPTVNLNRMLL